MGSSNRLFFSLLIHVTNIFLQPAPEFLVRMQQSITVRSATLGYLSFTKINVLGLSLRQETQCKA